MTAGAELLVLPDDEMWLMQPVLEGMISYTELLQTNIRLADIARMNDALTVKYTNRARLAEWERDHS